MMTLRILDYIFLFYFITHIPITVFFDLQVIFPPWIYPEMLRDLRTWYCREFKDPMMADPPPWFKSFCLCETIVQFPFFFFGIYAFWNGIQKCRWIRVPLIVYSTHVATTTVAICYHILVNEFDHPKYPGPKTFHERCTLFLVYFPYLFVPFLLLFDALFSSVYFSKEKMS